MNSKFARILVLSFLVLNLVKSYSQAYYSNDTATFANCLLVDNGEMKNSLACQVIEGDSTITYGPDVVKEYKFKDGRFYKSFNVELPNVKGAYFLKRIVQGSVELYVLPIEPHKYIYFLVKVDESQLIYIPANEDEYLPILESFISDCPDAIKNLKYLKYKKENLSSFFKSYNNCGKLHYPKVHYGFFVSATSNKIIDTKIGDNFSSFLKSKYSSISFGSSIDIPIKSSGFSFHPEVIFQSSNAIIYKNETAISKDLILNYASITTPLLIRYTKLKNKINPFIQVGPDFSRIFNNSNVLYQYDTIDENIFIEVQENGIINKYLVGYSIGGGFISGYDSRLPWFVELKYGKHFHLNNKNKTFNLGDINLTIGVLL